MALYQSNGVKTGLKSNGRISLICLNKYLNILGSLRTYQTNTKIHVDAKDMTPTLLNMFGQRKCHKNE